jgi:hypothetical protein
VDEPRTLSDTDCTAAHRSLQITPPPFDPKRVRPRAVVYVHLAAEALTAGTGIARVEIRSFSIGSTRCS